MRDDVPESEKRAEDEDDPARTVADEVVIDGRNVGHVFREDEAEDEDLADSPELDAEVQSEAEGK